jgi:hypothetical protein
MAKTCDEFMKGYTDAGATSKEKLEYAQCVNENVYIVGQNNVYDNEPLMFGIIFLVILVVAFALGTYIKYNRKEEK